MLFCQSFTSTSIAPCSSYEHFSKNTSLNKKRIQTLFEKSLQKQITECQLHPIPIYARIASGNLIHPEIGEGNPPPFPGSRDELIGIVTKTVHATHNSLYFDGLQPFLNINSQIETHKTFREIKLYVDHEGLGRTCFGKHFTLLKNLKENHNIEGSLAVMRGSSPHNWLGHAAVIIECSNGFVLLDISSNATEMPAFVSISFGQTLECMYNNIYFSITASQPGSNIPLSFKRIHSDHPGECKFNYCTNIANGYDLAIKKYVVDHAVSDSIPISFYRRQVDFVNPDQSIGFVNPNKTAHKLILVCPSQSEIVFKDRTTTEENQTKKIPFKSVLEKGFLSRLKTFLQPNYCHFVPDLNIPAEDLHQQLITFISQIEKIKKFFRQNSLDEPL